MSSPIPQKQVLKLILFYIFYDVLKLRKKGENKKKGILFSTYMWLSLKAYPFF